MEWIPETAWMLGNSLYFCDLLSNSYLSQWFDFSFIALSNVKLFASKLSLLLLLSLYENTTLLNLLYLYILVSATSSLSPVPYSCILSCFFSTVSLGYSVRYTLQLPHSPPARGRCGGGIPLAYNWIFNKNLILCDRCCIAG